MYICGSVCVCVSVPLAAHTLPAILLCSRYSGFSHLPFLVCCFYSAILFCLPTIFLLPSTLGLHHFLFYNFVFSPFLFYNFVLSLFIYGNFVLSPFPLLQLRPFPFPLLQLRPFPFPLLQLRPFPFPLLQLRLFPFPLRPLLLLPFLLLILVLWLLVSVSLNCIAILSVNYMTPIFPSPTSFRSTSSGRETLRPP